MASNLPDQPFLQRLAHEITGAAKRGPQLIVLPNRRSLFKLRAMLEPDADIEIFTIDDLMEKLSGLKLIEPEELQVSFYQLYCRLEEQPQSFDQFTSWAVTFLSDINELDLHLGDVDALYAHIEDYHQTGAPFVPEAAGPMEKAYLSFWERLPRYYKALREELHAIRLGYRGLLYRGVAESPTSTDAFFNGKTIHWVGIIPGNPSERLLLDHLDKHHTLQLFADIDQHYLSIPEHEAGRLFREQSNTEKLNWTCDLLRTTAKRFQIEAFPGQVAQVMALKQHLDALPRSEWAKTVVVLADTTLLSPILEVLHEQKEYLNITSGIPMRSTLIHRFMMSWLTMHGKQTKRGNERYFYHKHIEALLEYPVVQHWLSGALNWQVLKDHIVERNMKFIALSWLREKMSGDLFAEQAFHLLFDWPDALNEVFERMSTVLAAWKGQTDQLPISLLEREAMEQYIAKLKLLLSQFGEVLPHGDLSGLKKFVHRQIGYTSLFIEQPKNEALQLMGMLETRMIDFEHVWILGAADDFLPGTPRTSTHIPFMHRLYFKLPTRKDTEALMAYHFYRLLERSSDVRLIYNSNAEALSSGEPSRYIMQLKEELLPVNPKIEWTESVGVVQLNKSDLEPLEIRKTQVILDDIKSSLERRLSPSAINTFISSPLEFYYYHVLGLREQDTVEEEMESNTMGSAVHDALEAIYRPFEGKLLHAKDLPALRSKALTLLEEGLKKKFDEADLSQGKNYLGLETARHLLSHFLAFEEADLRANGPVEILRLEERLSWTLNVRGVALKLFGFADRIDRRGEEVRIIDYKTGVVKPDALKFNPQQCLVDTKWGKAIQLAIYKYMYCKMHQRDESKVGSYIVSMRNLTAGYLGLEQESISQEVEQFLGELVGMMLDPEQVLAHKEDSKYTTF